MQTVQLNQNVKMPVIGLGVYGLKDLDLCQKTVEKALSLGYRRIDTAESYGNEAAVGKAISQSDVTRDQLFITDKLNVASQTYDGAKQALNRMLKRLKTDYLDLLLIHHPYNDIYGTWRAMAEFLNQGKVRAIGISNFPGDRLEDLMIHSETHPQLMQIEINPYNQQDQLVQLMQKDGVQAEAWSPLAEGKLGVLKDPTLTGIAHNHNKAVAQIILRWLLQRGITVVPRSTNPKHLQENLELFDFALTDDEMKQIKAINRDQSINPQLHDPAFVHTLSAF